MGRLSLGQGTYSFCFWSRATRLRSCALSTSPLCLYKLLYLGWGAVDAFRSFVTPKLNARAVVNSSILFFFVLQAMVRWFCPKQANIYCTLFLVSTSSSIPLFFWNLGYSVNTDEWPVVSLTNYIHCINDPLTMINPKTRLTFSQFEFYPDHRPSIKFITIRHNRKYGWQHSTVLQVIRCPQ